MNIINISKQKIFDNKNQVYAYELVFRDTQNLETVLSSNIRGTAQLIISSITSPELDKLLGSKTLAFINIDEDALLKGILDVLDKDRFILNISENIQLTENIISKIIQYKKRGFILSLEHFDSSAKMLAKFNILFNYIDIIKMDVVLSEPENLEKVMAKLKGGRVKLLAQNIETKEDLKKYMEMGFDFFQGYYLDKPDIMEIVGSKEPAQFIILQLIKIIKDNNSTEQLEFFIKKQPDLSYKLIQFFNNSKKFSVKVESLTQVITLMGRDKLLRWLLVYLYSETSKNPASKTILALAIKRGERMEAEADARRKDKAYLAGMFSMLGSIFETDIRELMNHI
ncbi:MAG: diguanylate phosphodiesterase, partial [Sulfurimonas sp. RIFCSPHIGHO2_12_FULL_36_9]